MRFDPSNYRFSDLVDMTAFSRMLESFFRATGIPNGVVDASGELLSLSAGVNACTQFHRACPASAKHCEASNIAIMHDLRNGCIAGGLCENGLMDYATPVVIEGRQLATLFLGQVLHQPPDLGFFRAKAKEYGYDEKTYIASIKKIAVVDKERLEKLMAVMVEMAQMLAISGLARLRQTVLEYDLGVQSEQRIQLEDILNSSPVAIGWSDADGRIEYTNHQFSRLFGYSREELPDLNAWYRLAYPNANYRASVIEPWILKVREAQQLGTTPPELESSVTCKDGTTRRIVVRVSWVGDRRLVNFTDITDRWLSEQRKQAHDTMLAMVARGVMLNNILTAIVEQVEREDKLARCSVLLLDAEDRHLLVGAAQSLPDFYNQAVHGIEIGMGVGSCGTAAYLGQRVIAEDIQTHEYWQPYKGLAEQAGLRSCWSEPILSSQGKVLGTFAIYHGEPSTPQPEDIERISFAANLAAIAIENRHAHDELERRAYSDYLTGLANRRRFFELAETELTRAKRYGSKVSMLMLDVDHFKKINDNYGHKAGDLVLQKLSSVCRNVLRNVDVIGRIGGEEFAVLLPETGDASAMEAAERLRTALAAAQVPLEDGRAVQFTASFGVTAPSAADSDVESLLNQADQALYFAKNNGRNQVSLYQAAA